MPNSNIPVIQPRRHNTVAETTRPGVVVPDFMDRAPQEYTSWKTGISHSLSRLHLLRSPTVLSFRDSFAQKVTIQTLLEKLKTNQMTVPNKINLSSIMYINQPGLLKSRQERPLGSYTSVGPYVYGPLAENIPYSFPSALHCQSETISGDQVVNRFLIIANEIVIETNTVIIIGKNINNLTIITDKLVCGTNVKIVSQSNMFEPAPKGVNGQKGNPDWDPKHEDPHHSPKPGQGRKNGGHGGRGGDGDSGRDGDDAPRLELWAVKFDRLPNIALIGGDGQDGGNGGNGGIGGDGLKGFHSASNIFNCNRGPGHGGNGGNGGDGGSGGDGGDGGKGGIFALHTSEVNINLSIDLSGGRKGVGGSGGKQGTGGDYGRQGEREGWCKTAFGSHDRDGKSGQAGKSGTQGRNGIGREENASAVYGVQQISFIDDIPTPVTSNPIIQTIDPLECHPGDTIAAAGMNLKKEGYTTKLHLGRQEVAIQGLTSTSFNFKIDPAITAGNYQIVVKLIKGTEILQSNYANILVKGRIVSVEPGILIRGSAVKVTCSGLTSSPRLRINNEDVLNLQKNGDILTGTLPIPSDPYKDFNTHACVQVLDQSNVYSYYVRYENCIDFGMRPYPNGYAFVNGGWSGVGDIGMFKRTYGQDAEVRIAFGDVVALAWFGFYKWFFVKKKPGLCFGMSNSVLYAYLVGSPGLFGDDKDAREKFLTEKAGKMLSQEVLLHFYDQIRTPDLPGRLQDLELSFDQVLAQSQSGNSCVENANFIALLPQGGLTADPKSFFNLLPSAHIIAPYKMIYPSSSDSFIRRFECYNPNNPGQQTDQQINVNCLDFYKENGRLKFKLSNYGYNGTLQENPDYKMADGWTIAVGNLKKHYIDDVDIPRADFLANVLNTDLAALINSITGN
ncbi:MAG: hypothetical protein JXR76_14245 [Deltaproteobacteria bacterium]|nr:hypothetical protein [Deltaproteobacteria bacterium]